jgi:hypothetical protein
LPVVVAKLRSGIAAPKVQRRKGYSSPSRQRAGSARPEGEKNPRLSNIHFRFT